MKHVVMFSGGAGSWAAAKRVICEHGTDNVTLLFADTCSEDWDLYRFLDDAEKNLGMSITRLCDGRSIWQVFEDERFIGNSRIDPCSKLLKRKLLDGWRNEHCSPDSAVIYVGYDWSEGHRAKKLSGYVAPWDYQFPMFARPLLTKHGMLEWMRSEGLRPPRLYDFGFEHNNCGGFCVKAGHAHFRHLLKVMPDVYRRHELNEERLREKIGDYSVLRDRRGGTSKTMTLRQFRLRVDTEERPDPNEEFGGCGCAMDYEQDEPVLVEGN